MLEALRQGVTRLGAYPATAGTIELRSSAARWLERRFTLRAGSVDPATMVLPVNGTREALFALVQAAVDTSQAPLVITPNPFYQIYEGAALLAGATPYYLNATAATTLCPTWIRYPGGAGSHPGAVPVQPRQSHRRGAA